MHVLLYLQLYLVKATSWSRSCLSPLKELFIFLSKEIFAKQKYLSFFAEGMPSKLLRKLLIVDHYTIILQGNITLL